MCRQRVEPNLLSHRSRHSSTCSEGFCSPVSSRVVALTNEPSTKRRTMKRINADADAEEIVWLVVLDPIHSFVFFSSRLCIPSFELRWYLQAGEVFALEDPSMTIKTSPRLISSLFADRKCFFSFLSSLVAALKKTRSIPLASILQWRRNNVRSADLAFPGNFGPEQIASLLQSRGMFVRIPFLRSIRHFHGLTSSKVPRNVSDVR